MSFIDKGSIRRMPHLADVLLLQSTVQQQRMEHEMFTWEANTGHVLFTWEEYTAFIVVRQSRRVMAIAIWWSIPKANQGKILNVFPRPLYLVFNFNRRSFVNNSCVWTTNSEIFYQYVRSLLLSQYKDFVK